MAGDAHAAQKDSEPQLCSNCVGEPFLSAEITNSGADGVCSNCGNLGKVLPYDHIASEIDTAFRVHLRRSATAPTALEQAMGDDIPFWQRPGEPAAEAIASACRIDAELAEQLREILAERHEDPEAGQMGEECEFDADVHYEDAEINDAEFHAHWQELERSLKTESRFFNRVAVAVLDSIFEELAETSTYARRRVIRKAGPGTKLQGLFRARVFQADEPLKNALERPDIELSAPPPGAANAGRMNARGVSVFYGASHGHVALSEVRPPVGSRVLVGHFEIVRPIRLLDVEALHSLAIKGSIFDRGYARRLERAKFLGALAQRISMPVMPNDEATDYLVTQAMADYLAGRPDLKLDGIIYRAAQDPRKGFNVVLFNAGARTEALPLPSGTTIEASLYQNDEDGASPDYWVSEHVPDSDKDPDRDKQKTHESLFDPLAFLSHSPADQDLRAPTLRVDPGSLQVLHIHAVTFKTTAHDVARHRFEQRTRKF